MKRRIERSLVWRVPLIVCEGTDEHATESANDLELDLSKTLCGDVLRTMWSLVTNWTFLFTALYGTCDAMLIDGFQTFGPKYLQQQFALTSSMAGIVFGK